MAKLKGKFFSTFQNTSDDISNADWINRFRPQNAALWEQEPSGSIQYFANNGCKYFLIMNFKYDRGVSIQYDCFCKPDFSKNFSMISVFDRDQMDNFLLLENGTTLPAGSFVNMEDSFMVLKNFLNNPTKMPSSLNWIDSESLNWPEDY